MRDFRSKVTQLQTDINVQNDYSTMPLHEAVMAGDVGVVIDLLHSSCDLTAKDEDGNTPLHYAALYYAATYTPVSVIKKSIKNKTVVWQTESDSESGATEEVRAKRGRMLEVAQLLLLDGRANITLQNKKRQTPLHFAVYGEGSEMAKSLLNVKADILARDLDGDSPLHLAAYAGNIEAVKLLLENNAIIEVENNYGETPLHCAVRARKADIVKLLLQAKANVGHCDKRGRTALHFAARDEDVDIINVLLIFGADLKAQDAYGVTSEDIIRGSKRLKLNFDEESRLD